MSDNNHIGKKSWNRLTYRQKQSIIKNRASARKLFKAYTKEQKALDVARIKRNQSQ
jgi:hypothetical protein